MSGGLFARLKNKNAQPTAKEPEEKGNWFSKLKGKNMNGGVVTNEVLKVPLTHLSPDYLSFDMGENIEDELLEDEEENTYHKSDTDKTGKSEQLKKRREELELLNEPKQENNLIAQLKKDVKAGLIDQGSVGSQTAIFNHRDTIKKIKALIASKRAPFTLTLAFFVMISVITLAASVSIYFSFLKGFNLDTLDSMINEANSLGKISIHLNNILTYQELNKAEQQFSNVDFNVDYTQPIYGFIKTQAYKSFEDLQELYQSKITTLNLGKSDSIVINDYFLQQDIFKIKAVAVELTYLAYLNYCIEGLLSHYNKEVGTNVNRHSPEPIMSENILNQMKIQYNGYKLNTQVRQDQLNTFKLINTIDYSVRLILIFICVLVSLPLIYKASLRSGQVLIQISKISQINITFYMQHYNKLSLLLKSNETNSKTLEAAENFYSTEFRMKSFREQISGVRGARFAKWNSSTKYKWIGAGVVFVVVLVVGQIGDFIQFLDQGIDLESKVSCNYIIEILILFNFLMFCPQLIYRLENIEFIRKISEFNALVVRVQREKQSSGLDLEKMVILKQTTLERILKEHNQILFARQHSYRDNYLEELDKLQSTDLCKTIFSNLLFF